MDTQQFFRHALEIARANLPYTEGQDQERAARSALEEAHVNLSQAQFFAAVDALGGHEALVRSLTEALECPLCEPSNDTLQALLHREAVGRGERDERHTKPIRTITELYERLGWEWEMLDLDPSEA